MDPRTARCGENIARGGRRRQSPRHCWVRTLFSTVALLLHRVEALQTDSPPRPRPPGPKVKLATGRTVTNLASYNFYNFNANEQIKEKAIQTLRTYGVGPCGPPQFYGTQDVHVKAEADIASFLGTEGCIVYAQSFSTISSVIPRLLQAR